MEGVDLAWFHDVRVIPQAVEQLRAVRLRINQVEMVCLCVRVLFFPSRYGMRVGASLTDPASGQWSKWAKTGQRIRVRIRLTKEFIRSAHDCNVRASQI